MVAAIAVFFYVAFELQKVTKWIAIFWGEGNFYSVLLQFIFKKAAPLLLPPLECELKLGGCYWRLIVTQGLTTNGKIYIE